MPPYSAEELIEATNRYRAELGLKPLQVNDTLTQAAMRRAMDMAASGEFTHRDAQGNRIWPNYLGEYNFAYAGENLARGYSNATSVMDAWKNSQTHNAAFLNDAFSELGIAVVPAKYKGQDTYFVVQFFGSPKVQVEIKPKEKVQVLVKPEVAERIKSQELKPAPKKPDIKFQSIRMDNANSTIPFAP